jgi:DNA-binding response OmpR family regulator
MQPTAQEHDLHIGTANSQPRCKRWRRIDSGFLSRGPTIDEANKMFDKTDTVEGHELELRAATNEVVLDGKPVVLTRTQFRLLQFLVGHAGMAFSRQQIIEAVHGPHYPATDRSVDSQVLALRRALGDRGSLIESVRGVGYRFKADSP